MREVRETCTAHPIYRSLGTIEVINTFMGCHVFAVWGFMSALKSLRRQLTCVEVPWVLAGPATGRRLVNEIALCEESGELAGGFIGHFEL